MFDVELNLGYNLIGNRIEYIEKLKRNFFSLEDYNSSVINLVVFFIDFGCKEVNENKSEYLWFIEVKYFSFDVYDSCILIFLIFKICYFYRDKRMWFVILV